MLNRVVIILVAMAFLVFSVTAFAQAESQRSYRTRISWPAVDGAGGYGIEIQNSAGDTVFKKDSDLNTVFPFLPTGEYKLKITVLDRFKKPASESGWVNLTVIKDESPEIDSISPSSFTAGKSYAAEIKGGNFMAGCSVALVKGGLTVKDSSLSFKSSSLLQCEFDLKSAEPGDYTIVISNPSGKKGFSETKVTILSDEVEMKSHSLAVKKASPSSFFMRGQNVDLEILGLNLSRGSSVELSNGKSNIPLAVKSWDATRLSATIPSDKMVKGVYDLTVKQGGMTDTVSCAVKMKDPSDGLFGLNGLYFGIGYQGMIIESQWNRVMKNSFIGGSLYFGHLLNGLPLIPETFMTKHIGLELVGEGYLFSTKPAQNRMAGTMYAAPVCGGIYVSFTPFSAPLEFIIRGDAGAVQSYLSVKGGGLEKTVSSDNFCGSAGASFRYTFSDFFYTEAGSGWSCYSYATQPFQGLHFFARVGLKL
jgi:hypothetical protein